jgi:hypothetical protein
MVSDRVETFDRATLRTWRALNLIGWTVLGVVVALFFRFAGEAAAAVLFRWQGMGLYGDLPSGFEAAVAIPSSLVAGFAAGTLIGGRVYRRPVMLSAVAAAIAAGIWWFMWRLDVVVLLTAALMIPAAILASRRAGSLTAMR